VHARTETSTQEQEIATYVAVNDNKEKDSQKPTLSLISPISLQSQAGSTGMSWSPIAADAAD
jgi:hypothetical protein